MSETGYIEDCCWNDVRDLCPLKQGPCACACHIPKADHTLQAYCAPDEACPMVHPCHHPGCTLPPDQHPDDIQVTIHGKYGRGPMPVEFRDALVEMCASSSRVLTTARSARSAAVRPEGPSMSEPASTPCHECGHPAGLHTMRDGCTAPSPYEDRRGRRHTGPCLCWFTPAYAREGRREPAPPEAGS